MIESKTTELYGTSIMNNPVEVKYGRTWWQVWKPWKVKVMTPLDMQKFINERMRLCLLQKK